MAAIFGKISIFRVQMRIKDQMSRRSSIFQKNRVEYGIFIESFHFLDVLIDFVLISTLFRLRASMKR